MDYPERKPDGRRFVPFGFDNSPDPDPSRPPAVNFANVLAHIYLDWPCEIRCFIDRFDAAGQHSIVVEGKRGRPVLLDGMNEVMASILSTLLREGEIRGQSTPPAPTNSHAVPTQGRLGCATSKRARSANPWP